MKILKNSYSLKGLADADATAGFSSYSYRKIELGITGLPNSSIHLNLK